MQYGIAGIGSRGAAAIVDTIIQAVVLAVVLVALSATALLSAFDAGRGPGAGMLLIAIFGLAVFLVTGGYYMLFEILWNGQTPGKRVLGLRVIRENGYPIRPVDAVVRNLVRIVDWLPFWYGVGLLTMLLNARARRLGDFASGTLVVREGARGAAAVLRPAVPPAARTLALSSTDATLVRDFLTRRVTMHADARSRLAGRLATALARRYGVPPAADPERFLEGLAG